MAHEAPPKPTGCVFESSVAALTGMLMPWCGPDGQAAFLSMPGSPHLYLPLFDNVETLRETMERAQVPYTSIKQVQDGLEFFQSICEQRQLGPGVELKIATNIRYTAEGKVRFTELQYDL